MNCQGEKRSELEGKGMGEVHCVPVLHIPKQRTCIGTDLLISCVLVEEAIVYDVMLAV